MKNEGGRNETDEEEAMYTETTSSDPCTIKIHIWLDDSSEEENCHDTLICTPKNFNNDSVKSETLGCGILDSGCGKTVSGTEWMETYLDTLDETEMKEVKFEESDSKFKFGSGQVYDSVGRVTFPAVLGSTKVLISSDVVDTEIPLLLSKATMKKAKTIIDFENDYVMMFGEKVKFAYIQRETLLYIS